MIGSSCQLTKMKRSDWFNKKQDCSEINSFLKYCSDDGVLRDVKRNVICKQAKISTPPA